jgi:hypothetical protein
VTVHLLGRHVGGGAEHLPGTRGDGRRASQDLGDPEVSHLEDPGAREHQVPGLDVAVQHVVLVRLVQARAGREQQRARGLRGHLAEPHALGYRAARQPLHHEQAQTLALDEVVDLDDVRVVERGEQPALGQEARPHLEVRRERVRELLDRDVATELAVAPGEDDAPSAAAELLADVVAGQRRDDLGALPRRGARPGHQLTGLVSTTIRNPSPREKPWLGHRCYSRGPRAARATAPARAA